MPRLMASSAAIPVSRALRTDSDAIDPVESRMIAGRSMAAITSSTIATMSILSMTASMSSLPAMASMSTPSTAASRSTLETRGVEVDPPHDRVEVDPGDDGVDVHRPDHVVEVDVAGDDAGQVQPGQHELGDHRRPLVEQPLDPAADPHAMAGTPHGEIREQRGRLQPGRHERRPPLRGGPHDR